MKLQDVSLASAFRRRQQHYQMFAVRVLTALGSVPAHVYFISSRQSTDEKLRFPVIRLWIWTSHLVTCPIAFAPSSADDMRHAPSFKFYIAFFIFYHLLRLPRLSDSESVMSRSGVHLSVRPSVRPIFFLTLSTHAARTQCDSLGGSTRRGQRTISVRVFGHRR